MQKMRGNDLEARRSGDALTVRTCIHWEIARDSYAVPANAGFGDGLVKMTRFGEHFDLTDKINRART